MKPPGNHQQSLDPRLQQTVQQKKVENNALLDRAFDRIIGSQLNKIKDAAANKPNQHDEEIYQQTLERERSSRRKRIKKLSKEHEDLAKTTGLSGQVVALMAGIDKKKRSKRDYSDESSSSFSSDDSYYERRKKRRKEKKKRKKYSNSDDSSDHSHNDDSRHKKRRKTSKKRKRSRSPSRRERATRENRHNEMTSESIKNQNDNQGNKPMDP